MFNKEAIKQKDTVVRCDTEEKANTLLKWAHDQGLKWCDGESYLDDNYYDRYKEKTCYELFSGHFGSLDDYKHYTILEYDDVFLNEWVTSASTVLVKEYTISFSWHFDNSVDEKSGELTIDANSYSSACEKVKNKYPNVLITSSDKSSFLFGANY